MRAKIKNLIKKTKYKKFSDGEGIRLALNTTAWKLACCDCGKVHTVQFHHIEDDIYDIAFFTDYRATGQLRRHNYGSYKVI